MAARSSCSASPSSAEIGTACSTWGRSSNRRPSTRTCPAEPTFARWLHPAPRCLPSASRSCSISLACVLLSDPKLLLLDEPANGLDPAGSVAMRDTLKALAAQGKTVFISSHLLAEVQVMADVVGIIAAGKVVREGPLKELLSMEGVVKVRVRPNLLNAAIETLAPLAPTERLTETDRDEGWLSVHIAAERAEDVNQTLAGAGIYASGLESGADLEMLFLELTGGTGPPSGEGTFVGLSGPNGGQEGGASAAKGTAA